MVYTVRFTTFLWYTIMVKDQFNFKLYANYEGLYAFEN